MKKINAQVILENLGRTETHATSAGGPEQEQLKRQLRTLMATRGGRSDRFSVPTLLLCERALSCANCNPFYAPSLSSHPMFSLSTQTSFSACCCSRCIGAAPPRTALPQKR